MTTDRPKLLDLFCCAGGCSEGYRKAGFTPYGIDIENQPRYPFPFLQMDALEALDKLDIGEGLIFNNGETLYKEDIVAFHASPPCQHYSLACVAAHTTHKFPDLLPQTRERLKSTGKPWVIENVPNAPMEADFILCGSMFGLPIVRHRLFEMFPKCFDLVMCCNHVDAPIGIYGHGTNSWYRRKTGHNASTQDWREAMKIPWMTKAELAEAIPPAYTEFIGKYLMRELLKESLI
jgi:DNA (cytosine-5)-methyltransferase 1